MASETVCYKLLTISAPRVINCNAPSGKCGTALQLPNN